MVQSTLAKSDWFLELMMPKARSISILLLLAAGCGPAVDSEELGQVVYEVPMVPGAETPYPLPELKADATKSEEGRPGP